VHRAARARRWREHGELRAVEGRNPPATLIEAIDEIEDAYNTRVSVEMERASQKNKTDA
jgi:hypothetical protein